MSEPNEFPPPPFTPAPLELKERSGCRKGLLFGCGGLFLILALGLVVLIANAPKVMHGLLGLLQEDIMAKVAPEVPPAERERLVRAFEAARARPLRAEDSQALQAFQAKVFELSAKSELSREDVAGLALALERLAGPVSPGPPVPGGADPPSGAAPPREAPAEPGVDAPAPRGGAAPA